MQSQTITITPSSEKKEEEVVKKPEPEIDHEEFQIAADLTLYANPLRCLSKRSRTPEIEKKETKDAASGEANEIIAADLTKYGSPFDDKN